MCWPKTLAVFLCIPEHSEQNIVVETVKHCFHYNFSNRMMEAMLLSFFFHGFFFFSVFWAAVGIIREQDSWVM